jgi:hypothetical protein
VITPGYFCPPNNRAYYPSCPPQNRAYHDPRHNLGYVRGHHLLYARRRRYYRVNTRSNSRFLFRRTASYRVTARAPKNFALFLSTHRVVTFFAARYIRLYSAMFISPLKLLQRVSRAAEDVNLSFSTQAISQSQSRALIPYTTAQKKASLQAELTANRARTAAAAKETQSKRTR